jgi:hypothetical protein
MGILGKLFVGKLAANAIRRMERRNAPAETGEYLPASSAGEGAIQPRSASMVDRARDLYSRNPKLIGTIGMVAAAALLTRMRRR